MAKKAKTINIEKIETTKEFQVGDLAVYPAHGVGRIESIECRTINGDKHEFYILKIIDNSMVIMIPTRNVASVGLREVIDKKEIPVWPVVISAERIRKSNDRFREPLYRSIVRTPMEGVGCMELVYKGRGGWKEITVFKMQPSYETCMNQCKKVLFDMQYCPCDRLFKDNNTKGE